MPRNSSGTQSPANGPYVVGTVADPTLVNARFADEETEITDSLSRSGKGGMTAPLRVPDGSAAAPTISFTGEPSDGMYRAGSGDLRLAVGGVDALKLVSGGVNGPLTLATGTTSVQVTVSGGFLLLQGNRVAADITLADVVADSSVTRTAGNLFGVRNNGTAKLLVDYQGLLSLASQAAPIQPASIYNAITADTNYSAGNGAAYWKDPNGLVHMKGTITNNAGVGGTIVSGANALPVGFRPSVGRPFACTNNSAAVMIVVIGANGSITVNTSFPTSTLVSLDGISFAAE